MKQTRFIPIENCGLQVREPQEGQTESRVVEGMPIMFGRRSINLTPRNEEREVYEVLEPGCISRELIEQSDIVLNLNHSNKVTDVLGRCRNGNGTLSLELRGDHVECSCELPNTNNANDTLELMRRGDITGMSFAFDDDWQDRENGVSYERTGEMHNGKEVWLRHVKRVIGLYDVAIVTHPAYEQTSVATRELSDSIDKAIDEQLKQERMAENEQKTREAQEEQERIEREALEEQERQERERMARQNLMRQRARVINQEIDNLIV